ncbi:MULTISPECIES: NAD-dependent protein deacetylase [unclassified Neptuniibacter]|uniref:NAD-dependent protein deacetylase n=1 Tax=unclassified Neptuniibacter TaxID=2630693 RepID=UPI000C437F9D|nr:MULTISPECIES: NAD-dependent protein deacetylase [unclassified Neptuniibacter]MAY40751.1 NAD-dependent deacetylase [Oceanospirillaceae bacterium]|tara:strand:- start:11941 stop:12777 length:837 start_codon:yes stop_codon:yes gene_type:complete
MLPTTPAEELADFITRHPRLVVLTGAGVSTDSGIPAYRDKLGNWRHAPPVQHKEFMQKQIARQRFWARSLAGWPFIRDAQPSAAHTALAELEKLGHVDLLITQNVDRLHQKAGSHHVIDLHGRADEVKCMDCGNRYGRNDIHNTSLSENPQFELPDTDVASRPDGDADIESENVTKFNVPECRSCGGVLKPDVVYFGDNVPKETVFNALDCLEEADALLTVGSSLMVYSGFRFCKKAVEWNKPIAALNLGVTRADQLLSLKLNADISGTLQKTTDLLK